LRVGDELFFQRQLRAGGIKLCSMRAVDAFPVCAAQAVGNARPFGGVQAQDFLASFAA
jgi:hypothetical protein